MSPKLFDKQQQTATQNNEIIREMGLSIFWDLL